jgi:hypothetical protein
MISIDSLECFPRLIWPGVLEPGLPLKRTFKLSTDGPLHVSLLVTSCYFEEAAQTPVDLQLFVGIVLSWAAGKDQSLFMSCGAAHDVKALSGVKRSAARDVTFICTIPTTNCGAHPRVPVQTTPDYSTCFDPHHQLNRGLLKDEERRSRRGRPTVAGRPCLTFGGIH